FTANALRFFSPGVRGSLGLRAGGGEGESKDSLERSSFTADAITGVCRRQRRSEKKAAEFFAGQRNFLRLELWKVVLHEDEIAGTSTRETVVFVVVTPVSCWQRES